MNSHSEWWDFIVERSDLRNGRIVSNERHEPLADGEVLMAIERFALTANNLTYAISDEGLGFWDLFAAPVGFGRIPVWGHAVVERARHPDVVEGERFFGMFPMSSHWTFSGRRTRLGLRDESALRARVNPVYNQYAIVRDSEVAQLESDVTFRPLFITSFVLDARESQDLSPCHDVSLHVV